MLAHKVIATPVGLLKLVASERGLKAVLWEDDDPRRVPVALSRESASHPLLVRTQTQLGQYFAGERRGFQLPLDLAGTPFQRAVWQALLDIGYGERWSYEELAHRIGRPKAQRAVGAANGGDSFPANERDSIIGAIDSLCTVQLGGCIKRFGRSAPL